MSVMSASKVGNTKKRKTDVMVNLMLLLLILFVIMHIQIFFWYKNLCSNTAKDIVYCEE